MRGERVLNLYYKAYYYWDFSKWPEYRGGHISGGFTDREFPRNMIAGIPYVCLVLGASVPGFQGQDLLTGETTVITQSRLSRKY